MKTLARNGDLEPGGIGPTNTCASFRAPYDVRLRRVCQRAVLLTDVLAGLAPALESVRVNITGSLKGGVPSGGGVFGGGPRRLEGLLVSAQVAMSMVLLVGAGLFAQAENRTLRADPGYLPHKVVVAPLFFPDDTTWQGAAARLSVIAQWVRALPGVRGASAFDGQRKPRWILRYGSIMMPGEESPGRRPH